MEIVWHLDLGQIIIAVIGSLLLIIAWFIRSEIMMFRQRLDKHESVLFNLSNAIQYMMGAFYGEATPASIKALRDAFKDKVAGV